MLFFLHDRVSKRKLTDSDEHDEVRHILGQFVSENGEPLESPIDLPLSITADNMQLICKALLKKTTNEDESPPYTFFVKEKEVTTTLKAALNTEALDSEQVLEIIYQPQAVFQVRAVTRCTRCLYNTIQYVN